MLKMPRDHSLALRPRANSHDSSQYGSVEAGTPSATHDISRVSYHVKHLDSFVQAVQDVSGHASGAHLSPQLNPKIVCRPSISEPGPVDPTVQQGADSVAALANG